MKIGAPFASKIHPRMYGRMPVHCVEGRLLRRNPSDSGANFTSFSALCWKCRPHAPNGALMYRFGASAPSLHRGAFTLWRRSRGPYPNVPLKYASVHGTSYGWARAYFKMLTGGGGFNPAVSTIAPAVTKVCPHLEIMEPAYRSYQFRCYKHSDSHGSRIGILSNPERSCGRAC